MQLPGTAELIVILTILLLVSGPTYFLAKKKNFSIGWNIFWTFIFGPLWWIVMIVRKNKEGLDEKEHHGNDLSKNG